MSLYTYKECDCDPPWPACNHIHHKDDRPATPAEILAVVHDLGFLVVRGVTCETCDGNGYDGPGDHEGPFRVCPANCVNGLVPSPEAIEAGAEAWVMADVTYAKPSSIPWSETNAGLKRQYRARTTEALMAAVEEP